MTIKNLNLEDVGALVNPAPLYRTATPVNGTTVAMDGQLVRVSSVSGVGPFTDYLTRRISSVGSTYFEPVIPQILTPDSIVLPVITNESGPSGSIGIRNGNAVLLDGTTAGGNIIGQSGSSSGVGYAPAITLLLGSAGAVTGSALKVIPSYFRSGTTTLSAVYIGDGVTSIQDEAFSSCTGLISVTLPESLTLINLNAFSNCAFDNIILPNSLTIINDSAFSLCASLISVTIPISLTSIGPSVFSGCSSLSLVNCYTTKTVIEANQDVFLGTASPLTIHVLPTDSTWTAGTGLTIAGRTNVTVIKDL